MEKVLFKLFSLVVTWYNEEWWAMTATLERNLWYKSNPYLMVGNGFVRNKCFAFEHSRYTKRQSRRIILFRKYAIEWNFKLPKKWIYLSARFKGIVLFDFYIGWGWLGSVPQIRFSWIIQRDKKKGISIHYENRGCASTDIIIRLGQTVPVSFYSDEEKPRWGIDLYPGHFIEWVGRRPCLHKFFKYEYEDNSQVGYPSVARILGGKYWTI